MAVTGGVILLFFHLPEEVDYLFSPPLGILLERHLQKDKRIKKPVEVNIIEETNATS